MNGDRKERRQYKRRPILDTFSFSIVIPKKGHHRLKVFDVSDQGIGFEADIEGESAADFPIKAGDQIEIHFYVNQSLYLPLAARIARLIEKEGLRQAGAEILPHPSGQPSKSHQAFRSMLQMLDLMAQAGEITAP